MTVKANVPDDTGGDITVDVQELDREIEEARSRNDEDAALQTVEDRVSLNGREFILSEPSVNIVLRILNVLGAIGVKGERIASIQLKSEASTRAAIMGILAGMSMNDLYRFGSAVLQFDSEKEGVKWLSENGIKVAPLIKAFFINWSKSEDLQEALRNFFEGVAALMISVQRLQTVVAPETTQAKEEKAGEGS